MKLETQNEIKAKQLEQMLFKKLNSEYGIRDGGLSECIVELFDDGDIDSVYEYDTMTTELMSLCLHPDVQKHIPEWLKPEVGKKLLKLHEFFKCLCGEPFDLYMRYIKIKHYGYSMSLEEIESHERYYLNNA